MYLNDFKLVYVLNIWIYIVRIVLFMIVMIGNESIMVKESVVCIYNRILFRYIEECNFVIWWKMNIIRDYVMLNKLDLDIVFFLFCVLFFINYICNIYIMIWYMIWYNMVWYDSRR